MPLETRLAALATAVGQAIKGKANSSHSHAESDITNLIADLAGKAPTANPTFTGTTSVARLASTPVTLVDAGTVNTDAALGNAFRVTIGASRTFAAPINLTDGQKLLWEITASGGNYTPTFQTGVSAGFEFGTDITSVGMINSGTTCYVGGIYNAAADRVRVIAVAKGY